MRLSTGCKTEHPDFRGQIGHFIVILVRFAQSRWIFMFLIEIGQLGCYGVI